MTDFSRPKTVSTGIARFLWDQKACAIFAVSGGGSGQVYSALADSQIRFVHCRREDSCVYAATEASVISDRPAAVCVTSGEALGKAVSGLSSARAEAARILLLSGFSDPGHLGRDCIQPTSFETMPADFFRPGPVFDFARVVSSADELPWIFARLNVGFRDPRGFLAHLALPRCIQGAAFSYTAPPTVRLTLPGPSSEAIHYASGTLCSDSFAILAGFGARKHASAIRELRGLTDAHAFTTPHAKGVLDAPCIGLAGTSDYYPKGRPERLLVLGSRLSEASTNHDLGLLPQKEIVHVDLDPGCFGAGFAFPTYGIVSEVGLFLTALLAKLRGRDSAGDLRVVGA
jgi:acetolactate synthase I/II/III large subunit